MRDKKKTPVIVSGALSLALILSACATDDDNGDLDNGGTDPIVTTTLGGVTTTLGGTGTTAP